MSAGSRRPRWASYPTPATSPAAPSTLRRRPPAAAAQSHLIPPAAPAALGHFGVGTAGRIAASGTGSEGPPADALTAPLSLRLARGNKDSTKLVQDTNPTQTEGYTTLHDTVRRSLSDTSLILTEGYTIRHDTRPVDTRHYTTQDRRIHDTTRHKSDSYTTRRVTRPTDTQH